MLPPIAVSAAYADGHWHPFLAAFAIVAVVGFAFWFPVRGLRGELRLRDGFLVIAVFWVFLGLAGATPRQPPAQRQQDRGCERGQQHTDQREAHRSRCRHREHQHHRNLAAESGLLRSRLRGG
jgi:hypothetical protein